MKLVERFEDLKEPGDYCFRGEHEGLVEMVLVVPVGSPGAWSLYYLLLNRPDGGRDMSTKDQFFFHWDGNRESPTILPSLRYFNDWRGWVRGGQLVDDAIRLDPEALKELGQWAEKHPNQVGVVEGL